jgi:hypothetical protein
MEFNMLMDRYCKGITKMENVAMLPKNNFIGLPYIVSSKNGIEFVFKDHNREIGVSAPVATI